MDEIINEMFVLVNEHLKLTEFPLHSITSLCESDQYFSGKSQELIKKF